MKGKSKQGKKSSNFQQPSGPTLKHEKLKEKEDFYYENGFMVFTEKYLLRRGYCCSCGCRNCPYGNG